MLLLVLMLSLPVNIFFKNGNIDVKFYPVIIENVPTSHLLSHLCIQSHHYCCCPPPLPSCDSHLPFSLLCPLPSFTASMTPYLVNSLCSLSLLRSPTHFSSFTTLLPPLLHTPQRHPELWLSIRRKLVGGKWRRLKGPSGSLVCAD